MRSIHLHPRDHRSRYRPRRTLRWRLSARAAGVTIDVPVRASVTIIIARVTRPARGPPSHDNPPRRPAEKLTGHTLKLSVAAFTDTGCGRRASVAGQWWPFHAPTNLLHTTIAVVVQTISADFIGAPSRQPKAADDLIRLSIAVIVNFITDFLGRDAIIDRQPSSTTPSQSVSRPSPHCSSAGKTSPAQTSSRPSTQSAKPPMHVPRPRCFGSPL